jgi:hypothetical protein
VRIGVYPADIGGCGHYRAIWPAEAVARNPSFGAEVTIIPPDDPAANIQCLMARGRDGVEHVVGIHELPEHDVIVLQRPLHRLLTEAIPHLQNAGVAVVVDCDDDFMRIDPRNVVWRDVQPGTNPDRNWRHLARAMELADVVTVSTPALQRLYSRDRDHQAVVIPNTLPPHAYAQRPDSDPPRKVGWSGSLNTHPNDLPEAGQALRRLADVEEFGGLHVVGTGVGVREQLGLPETYPFTTTDEWVPIDQYHASLDAMDVGIVPLKLDRFNEGKSWLKGLEYAGRGIPSVASPTGPYCQFAALGGSQVAERSKDWWPLLRRLVTDRDWWEHQSDRAFAAAWALRTDAYAHAWHEAWTYARARRLVA